MDKVSLFLLHEFVAKLRDEEAASEGAPPDRDLKAIRVARAQV
jgi:hypothetical protein